MNASSTTAPAPAEWWAGGKMDPVGWDGSARRLSAEASSLGFPAGAVPAEVRIRSRRTGSVETFSGAVRTDRDGDTLYWTFRSAAGHVLVLFND